MFDFPKYQDLIREQLDAYLDESNRKLIIGPPGTGKTVIALFLAKKLPQNAKVKYLVYNKTLNDYLDFAIKNFNEIDQIRSTVTWHKWFINYYQNITGKTPPKVDNNDFNYDWKIVKQQLTLDITNQKYMKHVIIDEGQDMPNLFYDFLNFISESYYIFADENQIISPNNSTIAQIEKNLGGGYKKFCLKTNHRNTIQIAKLASKYYVGLQSGIPDLPKSRSGSKPVCYIKPVDKHIEAIKLYCRNHLNHSIGIFLPDKILVKKFYKDLLNTTLVDRLDYYHAEKYYDCPQCFDGALKERSYRNRTFWGCSNYHTTGCDYTVNRRWPSKKMKYSNKSIIILPYQSVKGLEFDSVIIPYLKDDYYTKMNENNKMKFYVMLSRAKKELILFKEDHAVEIFDNILDIKQLVDFK